MTEHYIEIDTATQHDATGVPELVATADCTCGWVGTAFGSSHFQGTVSGWRRDAELRAAAAAKAEARAHTPDYMRFEPGLPV